MLKENQEQTKLEVEKTDKAAIDKQQAVDQTLWESKNSVDIDL